MATVVVVTFGVVTVVTVGVAGRFGEGAGVTIVANVVAMPPRTTGALRAGLTSIHPFIVASAMMIASTFR